ncbi:MAG TPA: glycosyltransferase [Candidatus Acidoferrum sp.]|nr:glycosyltransferase [Candidatus Acidoferrum sp.]
MAIIGTYEEVARPTKVEVVSLGRTRSRLWRIVSASRAVSMAIRQNAHIYHVHGPENIPVALVLRLLFRKKVIYDSREDFPSMMLTKEYLPRPLRSVAQKMTLFAERLAARFLNGFITADAGTLRNYARTGASRKLVFYNFPNLEYFAGPGSAEAKKFDVVYRGGLSERAGTMVLLRAIAYLRQRGVNVSLLMFGYTDSERSAESIRRVIADLRIEDLVVLGGIIPHARMAQTLSQARVAVCPLLGIPKFMNNIPVKVFEAWACGLPVIATDLPPIRPFFPRSQRSLLVPPGSPEALAAVIEYVLAHPQLAKEYGRQANRLVRERYNNSCEVRKLLRFYGELLRA